MWPDERVVKFVTGNFLPARVHVKDDHALFEQYAKRYGAHWTPAILVLGPDGAERHRIEGAATIDDFLAQLTLGLGHVLFNTEAYEQAEQRYREVVDKYPNSEAAPEALYWAGVARYKRIKDSAALKQTARQFDKHYQQTSWAKKASVWK